MLVSTPGGSFVGDTWHNMGRRSAAKATFGGVSSFSGQFAEVNLWETRVGTPNIFDRLDRFRRFLRS